MIATTVEGSGKVIVIPRSDERRLAIAGETNPLKPLFDAVKSLDECMLKQTASHEMMAKSVGSASAFGRDGVCTCI